MWGEYAREPEKAARGGGGRNRMGGGVRGPAREHGETRGRRGCGKTHELNSRMTLIPLECEGAFPGFSQNMPRIYALAP
ncbi:unnamed protein product [Caenorhabditis auriculariae]|uniref:Uncharacterized protein n=1 Tax=Caenorhabditis auriculariae TaxID=2777116 RepID=A0A8S1HWI5_9PELO|nr:unnamed protein product [Caenorhabditis auriculariae]